MVENIEQNELQTIAEAIASEAPRIGKRRASVNAGWRWCREGILARNGERIRCEHVRVGSRLCIPKGAMRAFFAKLAAADQAYFDGKGVTPVAPAAKPRPPSAARREREIAEAEARLEKAGI